MRYLNLSLFFLILIFVLCADLVPAQRTKPSKTVQRGIIATVTGTAPPKPQPAMAPDVQRRYDAFIKVWSTIRDNYFDKTFSNLDWNAIKTEFEPKVRAAKTDNELYRTLNEMLGRLNKSHLGVVPPEVYQTLNEARKEAKKKESEARVAAGGKPDLNGGDDTDEDFLDSIDDTSPYGIGVELSLMNDRFVITRMDPNSAAEYAGLKRGFIIEKVNGVSLSDMLTRIMIYNSSIHTTSIKQFVPAYIVSSILNGEPDSYVTLDYLDENDQPKQVNIRREPLKEKTISIAPNFPPQNLSFESKSLDDKTGYIRFNIFAIPVIERFCEAIGDLKSKDGFIIDLRGNTGGVLASIPVLAGMLTTSTIDLGTSIYRYRSEPLKAPSKAKNFKGRIVVLVDDRTASAAEMFALSLRENGRALVVGQHTSGEALPSLAARLATGAMFYYPFANYRSAGGTYIEGNGIEPDRVVALDRKALFTGKDVQLETAKTLLTDDIAFSALKPKRETTAPPTEYSGPVTPPPPMAIKKAPVVGSEEKFVIPSGAISPTKTVTGQDAESKKYIDGFINSMGGAEALRSIATISLRGHATLNSYGSANQFVFQVYREKEDKFSELLTSEATGEIREVINGKEHFVQSDFVGVQDLSSMPSSVANSDVFALLTTMVSAGELYPALTFRGVFDRDGRKTAVVEGKTNTNADVAMAFDVESGMLVNFTKGYSSVSFGDYRKVGSLTLPFKIDQGSTLNVQLDTVKINEPIDPSFFAKRVACFDKVD
jgi:carboxyl-terminal processing protease